MIITYKEFLILNPELTSSISTNQTRLKHLSISTPLPLADKLLTSIRSNAITRRPTGQKKAKNNSNKNYTIVTTLSHPSVQKSTIWSQLIPHIFPKGKYQISLMTDFNMII